MDKIKLRGLVDGKWEFYVLPEDAGYIAGRIKQKKLKLLLQFTGLLDKHGKEIYVEDIVKTDNREGVHKFVVKYENYYCGSLGAFVFDTEEDVSSVHCEATECCEVIGNIYENPELYLETEECE